MLYSEGITVSVVATGEGASEQLHDIANAGHGRFYPGTDLLSVPQILTTEAVIASRTFINEGSFVPEVVGAGAPVRTLTTSPPLLGYVATTARPQAATWLRVGKEHDPLLASWRIGLGRVTAWTSDASNRWSQEWARWDGYPAFWSAVVKDTFAPAGGGGASMRVERNSRGLHVTVEGGIGFPDDSKATLRVATAAGAERTVALDRAGADAFVADIETATAGSYALTATVTDAKGAAVATASRLASQPYSNEYRPARADVMGLRRISAASGGRGEITPEAAFRSTNLPAGHSHFRLTGLLLWLAALLFPVDAALRRLSRRRPAVPTADGRPLPAPPVTTPSDARPPFVPLTPRPAPGTGGAPASSGRRRRRFRHRLSRYF